jgi:hypothetical protein
MNTTNIWKATISVMLLAASGIVSAANVYLECVAFPPFLTRPSDNQGKIVHFSVKQNGTVLEVNDGQKTVPLTTTDEKYEWQIDFSTDRETGRLVGQIDRKSGQYKEDYIYEGRRLPFTVGRCKKVDAGL